MQYWIYISILLLRQSASEINGNCCTHEKLFSLFSSTPTSACWLFKLRRAQLVLALTELENSIHSDWDSISVSSNFWFLFRVLLRFSLGRITVARPENVVTGLSRLSSLRPLCKQNSQIEIFRIAFKTFYCFISSYNFFSLQTLTRKLNERGNESSLTSSLRAKNYAVVRRTKES